jgi:hypothetical protein
MCAILSRYDPFVGVSYRPSDRDRDGGDVSLLERIIARRAELAEQAEHLAKELAEVERELDRVSAAEQVVAQLLAEDDLHGQPLQPGQAVGPVTSSLTPVASAAAASSPAAVSRLIAHRGQVSGPQHLPADYRALLEAVTAASCRRTTSHVVRRTTYLPLDRTDANLVFQLVSRRYEKGSIIITSNKAFSEWGQVFTDEVLATAILDRFLHHCDVISINGPSWRLKDRLTTPDPPPSTPSVTE